MHTLHIPPNCIDPKIVPVPIGDMSGSVQMANISAQTSGLYRCYVSNVLGSHSCYINLSVYTREYPGPRRIFKPLSNVELQTRIHESQVECFNWLCWELPCLKIVFTFQHFGKQYTFWLIFLPFNQDWLKGVIANALSHLTSFSFLQHLTIPLGSCRGCC